MMQELFYSIARALQWDSLVQRYLEGLFGAHDLPHRSQVIRMYHDRNAASGSSRATQLQAFARPICMARYRRYAPTLFRWRISWSRIGDTKRASTISRRSITNSGMAPTLAS